jgi:hypothetical protein
MLTTTNSISGLIGEKPRKRSFKLTLGGQTMAMRGGKKKKKKNTRGGKRRK